MRVLFSLVLLALNPATTRADETCQAWLTRSYQEKAAVMADRNQFVLDILVQAKTKLVARGSAAETIAEADRAVSVMRACQQRETPRLIATWDEICTSRGNTVRDLEAALERYADTCSRETATGMQR
jgi:hypothetical protein